MRRVPDSRGAGPSSFYDAGMATTCFCGCGREIEGLCPRANNEAAEQMSRHLAVMRGALERGETGDRAADTTAMVDEGTVLVAEIRRYLHGEISRDDLDRAASKDWLRKGAKLADALVASASGPRWFRDDPTTAHLAQSGQRATGGRPASVTASRSPTTRRLRTASSTGRASSPSSAAARRWPARPDVSGCPR